MPFSSTASFHELLAPFMGGAQSATLQTTDDGGLTVTTLPLTRNPMYLSEPHTSASLAASIEQRNSLPSAS